MLSVNPFLIAYKPMPYLFFNFYFYISEHILLPV